MPQFKDSITSSSWDHSNVSRSIGFSGTKDNSRLFPYYISLINSENDRIRGTDGQMLDLLLLNVLSVEEIEEGHVALWETMMLQVLKLAQEGTKGVISAVIDAGAILAGKSLKEDIVPWLRNHPYFEELQECNGKKGERFKGISFCDSNTWKVYDLTSH